MNKSRIIIRILPVVLIVGLFLAARLFNGRGEVEQRVTSSLNTIPRSAWGAVEPNFDATGERGLFNPVTNPAGWLLYDEPLEEVLTTVVVHHSALPLSDGAAEIQRIHMQQRGFADIGYHFVIDEVGQVYEGRKITVRGAHTGGHNSGTVGIALLGNFEETDPTPDQLIALRTMVKLLMAEYAITHLAGHLDFQPGVTVCPGENLWGLLPALADELGLEFGIDGYQRP